MPLKNNSIMYSIAIDGPAGAGKSSIARALAQRIGFIYVDTGALYRTVALQLIEKGIGAADAPAIEKELSNIRVEMRHEKDGQHVLLCGKDVTDKIRTQEVSMAASTSSSVPAVRSFLFSLQTEMADKYNVIMDGRDIGTVVLPKAQVKVFLTASPEVRAKRRMLEYEAKGEAADYEDILADIIKRDYQDSHREAAPLKPASDSVILDTSDMDFNGVIEAFIKIIENKIGSLSDEQ